MEESAMCPFCGPKRKSLEDEYGAYSLQIVKLTPLPAINLTTGVKDRYADLPYFAFFLYEDEEDGEVGSFPIEYCPKCGRKLE